MAYLVQIYDELQPLIDRLAGRKAGLRETKTKLEDDPCATKAYKLVGPLQDQVCGLHMRRDHRLAFTFVPDAIDPEGKERETVAILVVGRKAADRDARLPAAYDLVHEIFGQDFVEGTMKRTPCCKGQRPEISEREVEDAMSVLRRLTRRAR